MASTYSPYLQIQLIGTGDQSNTWGTTTNTNFNLFEQAVAGSVAVSVVTPNQALTVLNGAVDQARMASLILTTTVGSNFSVYAPPSPKLYTIFNNSNYVATIYNATIANGTTAAGTGIAIPANSTAALFSDGTNFYLQTNNISLFTQGTLPPSQGGTGTTTSTGTGANVLSNSPVFTGTPTAPTATFGTNTTQLATTGFVTSNFSPINSPAFTGAPTAPTAPSATNNTQIATTGFVYSVVSALSAGVVSFNGRAGAVIPQASDYSSFFPSLTGTGASGTWGINISGNAATVSNGVYNNGGTYGISISGNAATVSNGVYNNSGTYSINITGSAGSVSSVGWGNITGIPSLCYNNGGTYSINIAGSAAGLYNNPNITVGSINSGTIVSSGNITLNGGIAQIGSSAGTWCQITYAGALVQNGGAASQILTAANLATSCSASSNAYGNRTVSTSAPSGGSNGDIWYQV